MDYAENPQREREPNQNPSRFQNVPPFSDLFPQFLSYEQLGSQ